MVNNKQKTEIPKWFWLAALFGLVWNIFGAFQFVDSVMATEQSLISMGMTEAQAQTMSSYPIWMTIAFAIGTFGGLIGCIFLLLRKRLATAVFTASLVGYIVLYIGDITEGIFAVLGISQVIILSTVVLIAGLLLWISRKCERNGILS